MSIKKQASTNAVKHPLGQPLPYSSAIALLSTASVLLADSHFTFGSTGFTSAIIAWNDDVGKHKVGAKPSTILQANSRLRETSFARDLRI